MAYLNNLLETVFSGDTGLSNAGIRDALSSIRNNPDKRELEGIKSELEGALDNPDIDFISLLDNEKYEVHYANSQAEARQYIIDNIWAPLFSDEAR